MSTPLTLELLGDTLIVQSSTTGSSELTTPLRFVATEKLHHIHSKVYRGTFTGTGSNKTDCVCKLVTGSELIQALELEAGFYTKELKELQGECVPMFYGLYHGTLRNLPRACIILEYGTPLKGDFTHESEEYRLEILETLLDVHWAGVKHNDFWPHHVVYNSEGKPLIIDFNHAEPHRCKSKFKIDPWIWTPLREKFNCDECFWACQKADIWTRDCLRFVEGYVSVFDITTIDDLIRLVPLDMYSKEEALEMAGRAINYYQARYGHRMWFLEDAPEIFKSPVPITSCHEDQL